MINFQILSLTDTEKWNEYLQRLPIEQQDIYFTPEYYSLYEEYGDGKAQCFIYEKDGDIAIYPYLINSVNELGYDLNNQYFDIQGAYGYNGVISNCYELDFISDFFTNFCAYCIENNIIAEFTRFQPLIENHLFSENYLTIIQDRQTVLLDLKLTYEEIWESQYSSENRNMIRKALKNNIEIVISNNIDDYLKFFEIYSETMIRLKADKYFNFSKEYFTNFYNFLNENQILVLAKLHNEIIGGSLFMKFGTFVHYHLSAKLSDFSRLPLTNLILDYSINYSKKMGYNYFYMGGATTNNQDDSLLKFKKSFSKDYKYFYIGKKIHNKTIYNEVIKQWTNRYPEKVEKFKNFLLKYRY